MLRISVKNIDVKEKPRHPKKSPCCLSKVTRHQKLKRHLQDIKVNEVSVERYECTKCHKTFRKNPQGVSKSSKSLRVQALCVLFYTLGLSYDACVTIFNMLGVKISKATIWNYVQNAGEKARKLREYLNRKNVRVAGFDTTCYKVKGKNVIVAYLVDALLGGALTIEIIDSENSKEIKKQFKNVLRKYNVETVITDDADACKRAFEPIVKHHQVCITHVKKNIIKRCKDILSQMKHLQIKNQQVIDDCQTLINIFKKGEKLQKETFNVLAHKLYNRYKTAKPPGKGEKAMPEYRIRLLSTEMIDNGQRLFEYEHWNNSYPYYRQLDGTNNVTERAIGWFGKVRYKTTRGFKSEKALLNTLNLISYMWSEKLMGDKVLDLIKLVT